MHLFRNRKRSLLVVPSYSTASARTGHSKQLSAPRSLSAKAMSKSRRFLSSGSLLTTSPGPTCALHEVTLSTTGTPALAASVKRRCFVVTVSSVLTTLPSELEKVRPRPSSPPWPCRSEISVANGYRETTDFSSISIHLITHRTEFLQRSTGHETPSAHVFARNMGAGKSR